MKTYLITLRSWNENFDEKSKKLIMNLKGLKGYEIILKSTEGSRIFLAINSDKSEDSIISDISRESMFQGFIISTFSDVNPNFVEGFC